ncbi:MAG: hypothetical protein ACOCXZ_02210 [Chloroflexota bacterium]
MDQLIALTFIVICIAWPLVGLGLLFFIDSATARGMFPLLWEMLRALAGRPYHPRDESPGAPGMNRALGTLFILMGLFAGAVLIALVLRGG